MRTISLVFATAALVVLPIRGSAQQPRPSIMILGTYHMANPGRDLANVKADDVLAPARQAQIATLVDALLTFRPTKIALEFTPARDSVMNGRYAAFRRGSHSLGRNETEQIGFRVADKANHPRVFGIDYTKDLDIGAVFQFALANGQQTYVAETQKAMQGIMAKAATQMATLTIPQILTEQNRPEMDSLTNSVYLRMIQVGRDTNYVGARTADDWYARNFRIYANLRRLVTGPEDRVLVLIGSGHTALLRSFVRDAREWELVDPIPYLHNATRSR